MDNLFFLLMVIITMVIVEVEIISTSTIHYNASDDTHSVEAPPSSHSSSYPP